MCAKRTDVQYIRLFFFLEMSFLISPFAFAGGQKEEKPTTITMLEQPRQFIAPGNPDAVSKTLSLPFKTITIPGTGKVIRSWTFSVFDSMGHPVYMRAKAETRDRSFFANLFNVGTKPQVEIPTDLTWDGTFLVPLGPQNGALVPDGIYTYQLAIIDDAGKTAQTPPFTVVVKNEPISIDHINVPLSTFSPIGTRRSVHVDQAGSREQKWQGQILNESGKVVRTFTWENTTEQQLQDPNPPNFDWDGRDDAGNIVAEGNYFYQLSGSNRAGAVKSQKLKTPIVLSTKAGSLSLQADTGSFSPLGDGSHNVVNFSTIVSEPTGLQTWSISVSDASGPQTQRWIRSGSAPIPKSFVFDGKDSSGKQIPEGKYQAILSASYDNGNVAKSPPVIVTLDLTPPKVSAIVDDPVFGGVEKPLVTLNVKADKDVAWRLSLAGPDGKIITTVSIPDPENYAYSFSGKDAAGKDLPDGPYSFTVSGKSDAGLVSSISVRARKDTRTMGEQIELSAPILIPNRGTGGIVRITPVLDVVDSIESMDIEILDGQSKMQVTRTSPDIIPFWDWNGKDSKGILLPDGAYSVLGSVHYANGTITKAQAVLTIDSSIPDIKLSVKPDTSAFTPVKGVLAFGLSVEPAEKVKSWKLSISSDASGTVRSFSGAGTVPGSQVWDGRNEGAELVPDGSYNAKLEVDYLNGLSGQSPDSTPVVVSSAGPKVTMTLSSKTFVPGNIDGPQTLAISIMPAPGSVPIASWQLSTIDERGKPFRTWKGTGVPPTSIIWDGKSDSGDVVESGEDYRVVLNVKDSLGLETQKTDSVTIDILLVKISDTSYKIVIRSINFSGYSSDVFRVANNLFRQNAFNSAALPDNLFQQNLFVLRRLAIVLNKFPDYKIRLDGYAVAEYYDDPKMADWEQRTQLLPLSSNRATEVRDALVLLGVDENRFTVEGLGAENPLVPNSDLDNRWKNRRVEFYLDKK